MSVTGGKTYRLTTSQVEAIYKLGKIGCPHCRQCMSGAALAEAFEVNVTLIHRILTGKVIQGVDNPRPTKAIGRKRARPVEVRTSVEGALVSARASG